MLPQTSGVFHNVLQFAGTFESKTFKCESIDFDKEKNSYSPVYKLAYGLTKILFNDCDILLDYRTHGLPVATSMNSVIHESLNIVGPTREVIDEFLVAALKFTDPEVDGYIKVYYYKGYWSTLSKQIKREYDTIYLNTKKKQELVDDLQVFLKSKEDYERFGIPYKRTYLLEGEPGTGKTSLVFALASYFNMNICIMDVDHKMDDTKFIEAIASIKDNSILLIEDIDALFFADDSKGCRNSKTGLSFSAMLNVLDGVARREKLVTVITTNYIEKLDSALKRPGRIDMSINMTFANREQMEQIYYKLHMNSRKQFDIFYKKIEYISNITIATLQQFLFTHRNATEDELLSNIDSLKNIIDSKKEVGCSGMYN